MSSEQLTYVSDAVDISDPSKAVTLEQRLVSMLSGRYSNMRPDVSAYVIPLNYTAPCGKKYRIFARVETFAEVD